MCNHGEEEDVLVYIPDELSHTGKARFDLKKIDKCIASIVRALTNAGIYTTQSCCGHYTTTGRIDLLDGRILEVHPNEECYENRRNE